MNGQHTRQKDEAAASRPPPREAGEPLHQNASTPVDPPRREEDEDWTSRHVPHVGLVAVVGRANVGKSTLINALLEEKVSIVSPVAQTTRRVLRGIRTEERGQLVFLDTPGVHKAPSQWGAAMNKAARAAIAAVDCILLVMDGRQRPREEDEGWMRKLQREQPPVVLVLNKTEEGAPGEEAYRQCWENVSGGSPAAPPAHWLQVSALTGQGLDTLLDQVFALLPPGPLLFPPDVLTDYPRSWALADMIREPLFEILRDELPHAIAVGVDHVVDTPDGGWEVHARILVNKPTQKGIVIGHKGRVLRTVRRRAGAAITAAYERPVRLVLRVKVEQKWQSNHFLLQQLGYR